GEVGEGRARALPAERLHHQVLVDAADAGRVDFTLGRHAEDAEVDALRRQPGFASGPGPRSLVHEVGALLLQIATQLGRQRLDDAGSRHRRRIALVAGRGALAVSLEEHGIGLRAGAVRTPDPVARGTGDRLRAAEDAGVHATERPS